MGLGLKSQIIKRWEHRKGLKNPMLDTYNSQKIALVLLKAVRLHHHRNTGLTKGQQNTSCSQSLNLHQAFLSLMWNFPCSAVDRAQWNRLYFDSKIYLNQIVIKQNVQHSQAERESSVLVIMIPHVPIPQLQQLPRFCHSWRKQV